MGGALEERETDNQETLVINNSSRIMAVQLL